MRKSNIKSQRNSKISQGSNSDPKSGRSRIPQKYAKQVEEQARKQTQRNVRNFADLRRVYELQNINLDEDIDVNKASIQELRKIRVEQRKREQEEIRKRNASNKRGSAVQEIMNNDKMSKFAKMVAIKNLSASSRTHSLNKKALVASRD